MSAPYLLPLSALRVPSVAARLAGLCARAIDRGHGALTWQVRSRRGQMVSGGFALCPTSTDAMMWTPRGCAVHDGPHLSGAPFVSPEHFLATLTLTLAPQIAALRSTS